jgi:ketosteroid isomerase-like protein
MSHENIEKVRSLYAAWNRRDWDALAAAGDPDIVIDEPSEVPGPAHAVGHSAALHYLQSFLGIWDHPAWEVMELHDGGSRVVAVVQFVGSPSRVEYRSGCRSPT